VAELMGHIRRNRSADALGETAAMVWTDRRKTAPGASPQLEAFEQAARDTLRENGVGLTVFTREPDQEVGQIGRVLRSRGIRGVILAPLMREPEMRLDWSWQHHSVVIAGSARFEPDFHRVRFNQFADMRQLVSLLREQGMKKIGLELYHKLEDRSQHTIDGGFWAMAPAETRKEDAIFYSDDHNRDEFQQWLNTYAPDGLIVSSIHVFRWLSEIPGHPPVVMRTLENVQEPDRLPGIRQDYRLLGQVAAEQLLSQLQLNQMGIPPNPRQILLNGHWEDPGDA